MKCHFSLFTVPAAILAIFIFMFALSCHLCPSEKHKLMANKMILISAFIEDYRSQHDSLPTSLEVIKPTIQQYLIEHPDISNKYFCTPWQDEPIDLYDTPRGHSIFLHSDGLSIYYLYCSTNNSAIKPLPLSEKPPSKLGGFLAEQVRLIIRLRLPMIANVFHYHRICGARP